MTASLSDETTAAIVETPEPANVAPTPIVPRERAPGKPPRKPQAVKNIASARRKERDAPPAPPPNINDLSNKEFAAVPDDMNDPDYKANVIVIRMDDLGAVNYRTFGFSRNIGKMLMATMATAVHLAQATSDTLDESTERLTAVVTALTQAQVTTQPPAPSPPAAAKK